MSTSDNRTSIILNRSDLTICDTSSCYTCFVNMVVYWTEDNGFHSSIKGLFAFVISEWMEYTCLLNLKFRMYF